MSIIDIVDPIMPSDPPQQQDVARGASAAEEVLIDFTAPTPKPPRAFLLGERPYTSTIKSSSPLQKMIEFSAEFEIPPVATETQPNVNVEVELPITAPESRPKETVPSRRWSVMRQSPDKAHLPQSPAAPEAIDTSMKANSSGFSDLAVGDDHSFLLNEAGSFLLNGSHDFDTTLSSHAGANLSEIAEENEDEEETALPSDVKDLLHALGQSSIDGRSAVRSHATIGGTPALLPPSLTNSTRLKLTHTVNRLEVTALQEHEKSLLACSTVSYKNYRDSPARVVSITMDCAALEQRYSSTPLRQGGIDTMSTPESEGSSTSFRGLLQNGEGETSTVDLYVEYSFCGQEHVADGLYDGRFEQNLAESIFGRVPATATFEHEVSSDDLAYKPPSPRNQSLSASTSSVATVTAADEDASQAVRKQTQPTSEPQTPMTSRNGAERLRQRMEALRAAKQGSSHSEPRLDSSQTSRSGATPRATPRTSLVLAQPSDSGEILSNTKLQVARPGMLVNRTPRPSLSALPTMKSPRKSSSKENESPKKVVPGSARKDTTRERLDRLKEERLRRDTQAIVEKRRVSTGPGSATGLPRLSIASQASSGVSTGVRRPMAVGLPRPSANRQAQGFTAGNKSGTSASAARPTLADALARKPTVAGTRAFVPTVRPVASARPKTSLPARASNSASTVSGLPRAGGSSLPVAGTYTGAASIGPVVPTSSTGVARFRPTTVQKRVT